MKSLYNILGVEPLASQEDIKKAYKILVHAWHPDKFPEGDLRERAEEMMKDVNAAFSTLKDPTSRRQYDVKIGIIKNTENNYYKTEKIHQTQLNNHPNQIIHRQLMVQVRIKAIISLIILLIKKSRIIHLVQRT